jgi:hypothetical protein
MSGRILFAFLIVAVSWPLLIHSAAADPTSKAARAFPPPIESYHDKEINSTIGKVINRVREDPLNLVATLIFLCAIVHTFLAPKFLSISHHFQHRCDILQWLEGHPKEGHLHAKSHDRLLFRAEFFHFMGEVEAVFGIWLIPLFIAIIIFRGWQAMVDYVERVDTSQATFVVVIMAMAGSKPIMRLAEKGIGKVANLGGDSPMAWWLSILTLGPLLGSFIAGPAAMTISALLLRHRFYNLKPREGLKYGTLGLLFVNVSVGGMLTQFGSPPVIMVAGPWNWSLKHMLLTFGWKAVLGILIANLLYLVVFWRELARLQGVALTTEGIESRPVPVLITVCHIMFLAWTVANAAHSLLLILGLLFFLAFVTATRRHQEIIALRPALMVGFFLASLVIHGGCQQWWIAPMLGHLSEWPLMIGATVLTTFNDNAAITYLASLVPGLSDSLKYAVVVGAMTGGGLTVIANAPNPAGQSILASRFGEAGIAPPKLFLAAVIPTIVMAAVFMLFR